MAAPNIVNVATISGKTAVGTINTSNVDLVSNSASSGKVYKLNALYAANINAFAQTTKIEVSVLRGGTSYYIAYRISVPSGASIDVLSKAVYLEEGDTLRVRATTSSDITMVCSYEEIS